MPQLLFSFTINPETQEAAFAGNIEPQQALSILTQLALAEGIKRATEAKQQVEKPKEKHNVGKD